MTGVERGPLAGRGARDSPSVPRLMSALPPMRPSGLAAGPSRRDVLRRWEELEWWSCAYCDASFTRMVVAEIDHVVPLAKGGPHEWGNLAPACAACNRSKSDTPLGTWQGISAGDS